MCPILMAKDEFSSHTTCQRYKVKGNASYMSSNDIYLIECKRCGHQYVGETGQPRRCRINGHESPVAVHFSNMAQFLEDMAVMVVDKLYSPDPTIQMLSESRWIRDLQAAFPHGLDLRVDSL